jgi:hypothetical protein
MLDYYKLPHRTPPQQRRHCATATMDQCSPPPLTPKMCWPYTRGGGAGTVLVLCNYSGNPQTFSMEGHGASAKTLTANYDAGAGIKLNVVTLPAYGAFVGEVQ